MYKLLNDIYLLIIYKKIYVCLDREEYIILIERVMFLFPTIVTMEMKSIVYLINEYSLIIFAKSGE